MSDVTSILETNLYVDDMLKSFKKVTEAKDVNRKVNELCTKSGVNLTKFTSNSAEVLKSIPDKERKNNVTNKELIFGKLPEDKALGLK